MGVRRARYAVGMKIVYLLKIDSTANEYRFHRLALPPDGRAVHRLWGRMHEYLTERWEEFATPEAASKHFNKVVREKEREGYKKTDEHVLPKNFFLYVEKPAEATERPPDGQLNWLSGDG